jgi:hypothetical protein
MFILIGIDTVNSERIIILQSIHKRILSAEQIAEAMD